VTCAVCSRTGEKELQILKKFTQVWFYLSTLFSPAIECFFNLLSLVCHAQLRHVLHKFCSLYASSLLFRKLSYYTHYDYTEFSEMFAVTQAPIHKLLVTAWILGNNTR